MKIIPTFLRTTQHLVPSWIAAMLASWAAFGAEPGPLPFPIISRFENFRREQGMPCHKIHSVLKASDGRLWVGTWEGLLFRDHQGFHPITTTDGLSHKMVLSLAEDTRTGDLWVGTMRGLNRVSGGKVKSYLQTDSGLPNNVVYGVEVVGDHVWAATAAGTGDLNLRTGTWQIYDHNNAVMHEPWCYAVKGAGSLIYLGVWGGGIVEHDPARGTFKEYRDPDGDFHYDLVPDDGPVNDITSWLAWDDGVLWQCTYFGFSRFDGRRWRTWVENKSPLPSNFTQFVWSHRKVAWIGTDKGLSVTDGDTWVNYSVGEKGAGLIEIHRPGQAIEKRATATALADGFVLGVWVDDQEAWLATSDGLSHGILSGKTNPKMASYQLSPNAPKPSTDSRRNNITAP
jgi:hypothetical protein